MTVDREALAGRLWQLASAPSGTGPGELFMEPDDPRVVDYVTGVIRPLLAELGVEIVDVPPADVVAILGSGDGPALLIQSYAVVQHHNEMADPWRVRSPDGGETVVARGVSQAKAHQAVQLSVLGVLARSAREGEELAGTLYWSVNTEGRSSHARTEQILAALRERSGYRQPSFAVVQIQTGLAVTVGNRGRVDIVAHVRGRAGHSSAPEDAHSAIEAVADLVVRLRELEWPDVHPVLGRRHTVPYHLEFAPVAPHTLPEEGWVRIDQRLLPGDDPVEMTAQVASRIGTLPGFGLELLPDVYMLPALVDRDDQGVQALTRAYEAVAGRPPSIEISGGAFDAGGLCAVGIPAVMFGCGGGGDLLGDDRVTVSDAVTEAETLLCLIRDLLGGPAA